MPLWPTSRRSWTGPQDRNTAIFARNSHKRGYVFIVHITIMSLVTFGMRHRTTNRSDSKQYGSSLFTGRGLERSQDAVRTHYHGGRIRPPTQARAELATEILRQQPTGSPG